MALNRKTLSEEFRQRVFDELPPELDFETQVEFDGDPFDRPSGLSYVQVYISWVGRERLDLGNPFFVSDGSILYRILTPVETGSVEHDKLIDSSVAMFDEYTKDRYRFEVTEVITGGQGASFFTTDLLTTFSVYE